MISLIKKLKKVSALNKAKHCGNCFYYSEYTNVNNPRYYSSCMLDGTYVEPANKACKHYKDANEPFKVSS